MNSAGAAFPLPLLVLDRQTLLLTVLFATEDLNLQCHRVVDQLCVEHQLYVTVLHQHPSTGGTGAPEQEGTGRRPAAPSPEH